jgi:hypothetical protein
MPFPLIALAGTSIASSVIGGLGQNKAAKNSAASTIAAALIERQAAEDNKGIFYERASVADANAAHAEWAGRFQATRLREQAKINAELAGIDYRETVRAADVVRQNSARALQFAYTKAAELDVEAGINDKAGSEAAYRQWRSGQQFLGGQRVKTAQAGFVETGSELDLLMESAANLETERLDILTSSARESRRIRFAGEMTRYEGHVAAWDGAEQERNLRFTAELGKFDANIDEWNTNQEAVIALQKGKMDGYNLRSEARDLRRQGDLTAKEGRARYAAGVTGAAATRTQGRLGVVSAIGDAAYRGATLRG